MRGLSSKSLWTGGWVAMGLTAAFVLPARAAEEAERFTNGLRERGLHEYALEYLERMKTSPLVSDEFKQTIVYEQGATLIDYARHSTDSELRQKLFGQAREKLQEYANENAGTLMSAKANSQLANVLVERARTRARRAAQPGQAAKKQEHLEEARKLFKDAQEVFEASLEFYRQELSDKQRFPNSLNPQQDKEKFELRQKFRGELVQSKLLIATVVYERAQTYPDDSAEFKEEMEVAAGLYDKLYEDYRRWIAGLYARLYQGRCYQDLKNYKQAVTYYKDVMSLQSEEGEQPKPPAMRLLITKGYVQFAECLLEQGKYEELLVTCTKWIKRTRGAEGQQEDWLALRYHMTDAAIRWAAVLKAGNPKDVQNAALLEKGARVQIKDVVRYPNPYQKSAKKLLAKLGIGNKGGKPENFEEAYDLAKSAVDVMASLQATINAMKANKPDELKAHMQKIVDSRENAFDGFNLALTLVDEKTEVEKINLVRYYLCFLNWEAKRYYDAAILGEFLAKRYPDSAGARPGAKIAMASYLAVYNSPGNETKEFDAERVVEIAEFITRGWPDGTEADEAYNMLVSFMVQQRKADKAVGYLGKISEGFKGRGKAELKVGQALWGEYVRNVRKDEKERPDQATLDALKKRAQTTLEEGVARMREGGEVTETVARATLSLSQIYLDTSQYDKAVATLEDEQFGPLTLTKADSDASHGLGYAENVYKTSLRAFVASRPPEMDKAVEVMDSLENLVNQSGDAAGAEKLTRIFITLGRELEEQIEILKSSQKGEEEIAALSKGFELFLDRISKRDQGNSWASRNWVASTYYTLAGGFSQKSKQGKGYYKKAIAAYEKIIEKAEEKADFAPSKDSILGVQMRLAECERGTGNYKGALNRLAVVLDPVGGKPMMLDAQKAAAYAYQQRGGADDPKWYYYAIFGGRKDKVKKQNRIWGWAKLAKITVRYPKYRGVFHEARYNLAFSRYEYAKSKKKSADRTKYLNYAKNDIGNIYRLFPEMGGPDWIDKYDRLLKQIQGSLKEKRTGLKAFKPKKPATNATANR